MMRVRQALLDGDARLGECIKWQCPTFTYEGDLASLNPLAQKHVSLLFHSGAELTGQHHHLEGEIHTGHFMKFMDEADVEAKRPALAALARVWCDWKDRAVPKVKATVKAKATAKAKSKAAPTHEEGGQGRAPKGATQRRAQAQIAARPSPSGRGRKGP
jgi:hypothetical protein